VTTSDDLVAEALAFMAAYDEGGAVGALEYFQSTTADPFKLVLAMMQIARMLAKITGTVTGESYERVMARMWSHAIDDSLGGG
jgi:hypothetical protein